MLWKRPSVAMAGLEVQGGEVGENQTLSILHLLALEKPTMGKHQAEVQGDGAINLVKQMWMAIEPLVIRSMARNHLPRCCLEVQTDDRAE